MNTPKPTALHGRLDGADSIRVLVHVEILPSRLQPAGENIRGGEVRSSQRCDDHGDEQDDSIHDSEGPHHIVQPAGRSSTLCSVPPKDPDESGGDE